MDDNALIELFWARSPEAVAQTQEKYGAMCRSLAGRLLRCAEDVEECLNDTYLALWNAIPPCASRSSGILHIESYTQPCHETAIVSVRPEACGGSGGVL